VKENFVVFKDVTKCYKSGEVEVNALVGLDFSINEGEFVVIAGPSGAGKTTLLNLLGGMDTLTSGTITIDGEDVGSFSEKRLTEYRRRDVGFVFQFYNLMPNLTARENVELATEICKGTIPADEILESVGLTQRAKNFPSQLSGGEQQRVSIARAVAKNPKIILCDEPTGALDYETGKRILKLLHDICRKQKKTVVIVTHNGALRAMADRVILVKNGKAVENYENHDRIDIGAIEW